MRRKIAKIGPATLMISLPSKWVKKYGLKKGDELHFEEKGSSMILSGTSVKEIGRIEVSVKNTNVFRSVLGSLYRAGYDEFVFNLAGCKIDLTKLNEILNFFVGLEVEEFSDKRIVLKSVAFIESKDYDFFINKLFVTIKVMFSELIAYFNGEECNLNNLDEMRKNNLRSREYCMRGINKLGFSGNTAEETYAFLLILEKISGSLWHIGTYSKNNKPKPSKKAVELLENLRELMIKLNTAYSKKDFDKSIHDVLNDRYFFRQEWFAEDKLFKIFKKTDIDPVVMALLLNIRMEVASATSRFNATMVVQDKNLVK
ncbi:MAG: hypothetical protein Q8O89_00980 [Nanoarchaeota archaeon]|nr:hypothetical protein [Nanoarchaeota archaeon]